MTAAADADTCAALTARRRAQTLVAVRCCRRDVGATQQARAGTDQCTVLVCDFCKNVKNVENVENVKNVKNVKNVEKFF